MADFSSQEFVLSRNELLSIIADYLSPAELAQFRQVCHLFNHTASHASFLQPLYNRLYAIDKTLPIQLDLAHPVLAFKKAFEKIYTEQLAELKWYGKEGLLPKITKCTIANLEANNHDLNIVNLRRIEQSIAEQPGTSLILRNITRFIMPENQTDYFANLKSLDLSNNKLTSLNLKVCTSLQRLYCDNNLLTILDLSVFNTITDICCSNNPLRILNLNDCTALETVFYPNQFLTHLTVKNCTSILAIVPDNVEGHPLLVDLNLQGASQAVDKFAELEKELINKKLVTATEEEKPELIARLAERAIPVSYWDSQHNNTYAAWFEFKSQEETMDEDRNTYDKRKRNEDNEGPEFKRHKPNGL